MKKSLSMAFCVLSLSSCYMNLESEDDAPSSTYTSSPTYDYDYDALPTSDTIKASGFVVSAFEVTVDGQPYSDLEDFYTRETAKLPERMKAAGYDESYSFQFEAQVGFEDLWRNMTVYLLAEGKTGYAAKTFVDDQGGFKTFIPESEKDKQYRVRAVKRINLLVTKGAERKMFCYNFSAKEKAVRFNGEGTPVILSDFTSEVSAYDCKLDPTSGVIIPEKP